MQCYLYNLYWTTLVTSIWFIISFAYFLIDEYILLSGSPNYHFKIF